MPARLARRGRVKGYRPTYNQLQELLEIAQKDFCDASDASMIYLQGDFEITPQVDKGKILPRHVDEMIKDAGDPNELNNLSFSISQTAPMQNVEIHIGSGGWTTYRVKSTDQTWAYGRYHELTDKLMSDRSLYAKFSAGQPEILREDNKWRTTAWEVSKDWRELGTAVAASIPWLPLVATGCFGFVIAAYAASPGSNAAERQSHKLALQDVHNLHTHASILIVLTVLYIITLYAYRAWLRSWLRSKIVLRKPPLMSQFSFRDRKSGAVGLASFYIAVFTLIVTTVAVIISLSAFF